MTSSLPIPHNPYVGPRPFVRGETLYGRDTDLRKLINLLVAERIVLLCAPSGAGKTSLIQAALIPRLEARDFQVLPNIRVNAETPIPGLNRYVASTLQSLEERRPVEEQLSLDELGTLSIAAYLTRRGMDDSVVLIFDQFEEVLTADLADREAKHTYFVQLGEALRNRGRWALFAIREDYLAALQPYARPIPTQLGTVFRLDLLEADAARQAIQRPALAAGVAFADDAATRLIDDLRRVRVQRMEGVIEDQLGPYVEPVQLQVVCLRLWAGLPPEAKAISVADLGVVGDVDSALRQYYADQMQAIAGASGVREGIIRDWCERLISEQGFRTQVAQGARATDGLDNAVIQRLIDAHLLRAEPRRGLTWFELTHDRLVGPIQSDNVAWRDANLSPLQQQARLWERQQRPEGLLLRGEALAQAEGWAQANAKTLAPAEREYLIACQVAHAAAERERRDARRIRSLLVGVVVALVIALGLAGLTFTLYGRTEVQLANANAQRLAAQALEVRERAPQRGLLLALEALRQTSSPISAADQSLRDVLAVIGGMPFRGHEGPIYTLAFSPDGRTLATGSEDGTARLWQVNQSAAAPTVLRGHEGAIRTLAFSPDGRTLATGSEDGTARLWTTQISDLENLACAVLSRNLNWDEWQQYFGLDVPYRQTCPNLPIHPSLARPKVDLVATLVQKGELDRALSTYQQAQQIDPTLAPPAAWLVGVAANMVADHPGTAITAYEYARQIDSLLEGTDARTLNTLCWYGSIAGHAAVVLDACERAVALAPDDGGIRDSRGLARALTGNSSGAIEDFQAYIVWANQNGSGDRIPQRQDWIESLKAGRNPFDAQTLEQLKVGG